MPVASRVQLVPPEAWDEARLMEAARTLATPARPLRPGDEVGPLVVLRVDPEPGSTPTAATEWELVPAVRSPRAPKVDVAILLDASESMSTPWSKDHTRVEAARESVAAFLREPGPAIASVSLFHYAKAPRLVAGPAPPGEIDQGKPPAPAGRSATATALDAALAHLASRTAPDRAQVVFLLTDGVAEVSKLRMAAQRAGRLRIPVHSIVFAPEVDEVLDEVAKASGGSAQKAILPLTIEFVHEPGVR